MPAKTRSSNDTFARVRTAAAHLPEVEESTWYGTPALKVGGKGFARLKDAETLVVLCALDEKEMLLAADPEVYFETDHYKGWGAILVRLKTISAAQLRRRLKQAWRLRAPKRLVAAHDGK
ncbi:MAG TPA: MmcQ/YjbR family DNA-binding protein [Hyphomicrobiaceae bacterium]|nr:MmcQ/YjbR family DNA-binding protein [Hyphomicrobiaceae bacterium]